MNRYVVIALLALGAAALAWVLFRRTPPAHAEYERIVDLDVGLDGTARDVWRSMGEGSGVLPLSLVLSLRNADTGEDYLVGVGDYGLVPHSSNTLGLPIGLAVDPQFGDGSGLQMVGVNCSGCHSGMWSYRGTAMVIDGAPNMMDVERLFDILTRSVEASLLDPVRLLELVARVAGSEAALEDGGPAFELAPEALTLLGRLTHPEADSAHRETKEHVQTVLHGAYHASTPAEAEEVIRLGMGAVEDAVGHPSHAPHARSIIQTFGRDLQWLEDRVGTLKVIVEAFRNETAAGPGRADSFDIIWDLLLQHDSVIPLSAPVSIPDLFGYDGFHWVHWDGNSSTVFARDFAQAVALGAGFDPVTARSSVQPRAVMAIEEAAREIRPPAWPEDILGSIDRELAEEGRQVFDERCAGCHRADTATYVTAEEIGTDPGRVRQFGTLRAGGKTYAELLNELGARLMAAGFQEHHVTAEEVHAMERASEPVWRTTGAYHARSLRGIWASPPYLHNGSVPTLWHLLQPPEQRPDSFPVGRELDPEHVGLDLARQPEGTWVFHTRYGGNSNAGHLFGTDLSDPLKRALVEYLKTR